MKHEKIYKDGTRADFVFSNSNRFIVVEVKKGRIDDESLRKVSLYLDNEIRENPEKHVKGVLVGKYIPNSLKNKIKKSKYKFEIKLLNVDIPANIKICDNCRKANASSNTVYRYCGSRKFISEQSCSLNKMSEREHDGVRYVGLGVRSDNVPARHVYEKIGFKKHRDRRWLNLNVEEIP